MPCVYITHTFDEDSFQQRRAALAAVLGIDGTRKDEDTMAKKRLHDALWSFKSMKYKTINAYMSADGFGALAKALGGEVRFSTKAGDLQGGLVHWFQATVPTFEDTLILLHQDTGRVRLFSRWGTQPLDDLESTEALLF
eukprot:3941700-Rhodomonas_salina.3